jgi:hypothetical protein
MSNSEAMMEKGLELPENLQNKFVMCSREAPSGHTPRRIENMELERYLTSDIMSTLLAFFFCLQMALHN